MLRRPTAPRRLISSLPWRRPNQGLHTRPLPSQRMAFAALVSQMAPSIERNSQISQIGVRNLRNRRLKVCFSSSAGVNVNPIIISMPALSPTMSKGKISKWNVSEGDELTPGKVLCEIETDKATVDFENQVGAYRSGLFGFTGQCCNINVAFVCACAG
eukprot:gb/GECG01000218.1/.p1 GENE.gb/GECG01000218.1/~~gb/GECG01000218.1/.p1  ORF type:complete len:158 (+),score=9.44 gb/GECG01000218.1/:1-474(+)